MSYSPPSVHVGRYVPTYTRYVPRANVRGRVVAVLVFPEKGRLDCVGVGFGSASLQRHGTSHTRPKKKKKVPYRRGGEIPTRRFKPHLLEHLFPSRKNRVTFPFQQVGFVYSVGK